MTINIIRDAGVHIESDWLLMYKIVNDELILYLIETGSYSDL